MTHLDTEIKQLKNSLIEMWELVIKQMQESQVAIETFDKSVVGEIMANEKRVDAFEIKINMDCEHILALFNPLANDLRFVLSVLKINYNLERIGDYAHSIAKIVKESEKPFDKQAIKETCIFEMYTISIKMLGEALAAFEKEDNIMARGIFKIDDGLDKINKNANGIIAELILKNPEEIMNSLNLLSIIRKLERVGDQTKNIAEEIIFYIEAKVLRHSKKKDKL
jgi:phosphate transport system protein